MRRQVLETIDLGKLQSRGYSFQIEMSYRAWRLGYRLREIPIIFHERQRGQSKISGGIIYEALYVLWRLRLQLGFRRRPASPPE